MNGDQPGQVVPVLLQRLLQDHRELLPELTQWVEGLPDTPPPQARSRLEPLAERLRQHARLEEETLFAAMAEVVGSQALAGYEMQHDDIDDVLGELLSSPPGLPANARELADRLLWYCESHFETEEKYIFPEALERLSPERWAELAEQAGG